MVIMSHYTTDDMDPGQEIVGRPQAAVTRATPTTHQLAAHSLSANTRAAYARALRQFDAWRGDQAQHFLHAHGVIQNLFRVGRHRLRSIHHRLLRARAFTVWAAVTAA